jgi:hypothetical protein
LGLELDPLSLVRIIEELLAGGLKPLNSINCGIVLKLGQIFAFQIVSNT